MENPTTVVALLMARLASLARDEDGMSTVEYAIGLIAAAAFASLLFVIVNAPTVMGALTGLVQRALTPTGG
jgi:Flp pilus assembly pilin Flp